MMDKPIAVLGSTGSVGTQALDVAENLGVAVDFISAGSNTKLAEAQIRRFHPRMCAMADKAAANDLRVRASDTGTKILCGEAGILEGIAATEAHTVVNSILGLAGLSPTLACADLGKRIAIANKETLVAAGELVKAKLQKSGGELLPVDSEHSAIFQALHCGAKNEVKRILLTASGGPFYGYTKEELARVTKADALRHPTWNMGAKITIDSATLMNKGLEVIEAVRLFDVAPAQIQVVVHRESIIHSAVEYIDNTVIAQMGLPDMRACVQYALTYPARSRAAVGQLDLFSVGKLTFLPPDPDTFRLLGLAYTAIEKGGLLPCALSSANEEAVSLFLQDRIAFFEIPLLVEAALGRFENCAGITVENVFAADVEARRLVRAQCTNVQSLV